ncbi:MAG TPA: adenylate/guanylate cyclase domain-containing protein [Roseiarcus sp.]|jgi:adenylate cyclase|nr:adenylate/guanylate cyclase domain-containing protein [Roseiarcus sp.]
MSETRKIAAIRVSDVVGYSRLAGADEDRTLARLRALRSDLIDPTISVHRGRIVKRTGDGSVIEFRSVVDAVRCALEVQHAMVERNAGVAPDKRIEFRIGIHLGDVVEESDGDLMGDGVNIAARLEGVCEPGAICLSEDAYRQVKGRLDLAVSDLGPTQLKNIAEPIRVYSLQVGIPAQAKPAEPLTSVAPKKQSALLPLAIGIAALLVLIGGAGWWFVNANRPAAVASKTPAETARISIVVLPFANLSNDPAQDYFADGVTENLTTELSRLHNSFVIARNTAFTFKGKNVDAKAIGKELGVRYVLEGSVQRDGTRVRVNAQLIDAESGAHVWADRFEDDVVDLFKLQDEVVVRLARALQVELVNAEAQRSLQDRPQNPDAIDLTMRGSALLNQSFTKANRQEALNLFEQAMALDPTNADALAGAAFIDTTDYASGWFDQNVDLYARAMQRANQALSLNPDQANAHYAKARLIMFKAKPDDAASANQVIAEAEAALRADPSYARAYWPMAVGHEFLGHYEQAISDLEQAARISPRDSNLGVWQTEMGRALMGLGRYDAAVQQGLIGIDSGFRTVMSYTALAAFYAAADKMPAAKATMAEAMKLNPKLSVAWFHERTPSLIDSPPGFREALIKAGLPEE